MSPTSTPREKGCAKVTSLFGGGVHPPGERKMMDPRYVRRSCELVPNSGDTFPLRPARSSREPFYQRLRNYYLIMYYNTHAVIVYLILNGVNILFGDATVPR